MLLALDLQSSETSIVLLLLISAARILVVFTFLKGVDSLQDLLEVRTEREILGLP